MKQTCIEFQFQIECSYIKTKDNTYLMHCSSHLLFIKIPSNIKSDMTQQQAVQLNINVVFSLMEDQERLQTSTDVGATVNEGCAM